MRLSPRGGLAIAAVGTAAALAVAVTTLTSPSAPRAPTPRRRAGPAEAATATNVGDPAWLTYHHDAGHSGLAGAGPGLIPTRAAWTSASLDGDVYGEPLAADGVVIVATVSDTVYGLDAGSGAVRWSTHVGTPVALSALPCGDVDPLGILSTPVVDPSLHRVFVVAEERTASGVQHELVGLDTRSGAVDTRQVVDPPGMNVVPNSSARR